ncbi:MAG: RNA polymerase sigma factor RpoD/SigA [Cytophagales bacterium]|nr:RNA polymerase sigma factor RpoD/SigA [Cytophagales bacterium]
MKQLKILFQITNRTLTLEKYFQEVGRHEMISPEEEVILAQRIQAGDQIALEKLTKANLRFVVSVAKQYDRGIHNLTLGDLISEGNIGLMRAASKFDPSKGFKFISYAVWWIRQAIMSAISQHSRAVRQPMNRVNSYNQVMRSVSELEQKYQREPTDEEIAEALDFNEDFVREIRHVGNRTSSLDAPILAESTSTLADMLQDQESPDPEANALLSSVKMDVEMVLNSLTDREAIVLELLYGLKGSRSMTAEEIATLMDLSRERVRQIKECALTKLRQKFQKAQHLKSHLS